MCYNCFLIKKGITCRKEIVVVVIGGERKRWVYGVGNYIFHYFLARFFRPNIFIYLQCCLDRFLRFSSVFFLCHPFVYVHRWKSLVVVCILRDFAPSPRIFLCRRLYYFLLCSRLQFTPLCADFRPPHTHNSGRPFCEAPPFAASSNPQNAFSAPFYCLSLLFSDSGACLIETKAVIRKEFKTKTTLCLF